MMQEMPAVQPTEAASATLRVLVADDTKATRHSTCLMLKSLPNVRIIGVAENGQQALEMAMLHRPDLAILDIRMGAIDGIEVMKRLGGFAANIRFIAMSAERDDETLARAHEAGARDFLCQTLQHG